MSCVRQPGAQARPLFEESKVRITYGAVEGAKRLGLDRRGILEVLLTLGTGDFTKSMTTFAVTQISCRK